MAQAHEKRPQVALVIGAGSVKCAASLGVLRVLDNAGIGPDMVVGCSGGALYATAVALGMEVETAVSLTRQLWTRDVTGQRNRRALLQALFPRRTGFDGRFGLRDDTLVQARLRDAFGAATFAAAGLPLAITATDFMTGEQVVLQDGRLVDAIRASIAIPFVFAPWPVNGRLLIDGYLSDPLPVNVAMRAGADVIIAIGFESPIQETINSAVRYAFQVSGIMTNSLYKARMAFHNMAHHAEMVHVIPEFQERIRLFDTDKIPAIIAAGEAAMTAQLPYLQRLLAKPVIGNRSLVNGDTDNR